MTVGSWEQVDYLDLLTGWMLSAWPAIADDRLAPRFPSCQAKSSAPRDRRPPRAVPPPRCSSPGHAPGQLFGVGSGLLLPGDLLAASSDAQNLVTAIDEFYIQHIGTIQLSVDDVPTNRKLC